MDDDPRGVCLIISNETFENLPNRPGSECDVRALEDLFRNYLGFDVLLERDKTAKQMQDWLKAHAREYDFSGVSALAVAILTHGLEGDKFLGTDGKPVTRVQLASIFNSENCEALKEKPKLFIFQACRGNQTQEVGPIGAFELEQADAVGEVTAHNTDMCFVFATSAGYQAYRHPAEGSPFVTKFCQQVRADAHSKEFAKIIREITEHFSQEEIGNAMMLTDYSTQLTKSWYLNPPNPPPS